MRLISKVLYKIKLSIARFMVKILPKKPEVPNLEKLPEENQYEYQLRVPLQQQPVQEKPKLNYRGQPMK